MGFPPTLSFILKFQIFYELTLLNNLISTVLLMLSMNTFIVYFYLRCLNRILANYAFKL
jgi:NADH:ubiquinone oxidoreductase subunit 2 (subunit N)